MAGTTDAATGIGVPSYWPCGGPGCSLASWQGVHQNTTQHNAHTAVKFNVSFEALVTSGLIQVRVTAGCVGTPVPDLVIQQ